MTHSSPPDGCVALCMKYIIMCGGPRSGKPLRKIKDETIIARTIRLLHECGVEDIAISTNDDRYQEYGIEILHHDNPITWENFCWLDAFYPADYPVCYIFGDVFFSPEAIKTIVETETEDIEFFASAPPFSPQYQKRWAEPFAFKVKDTAKFFDCIRQTKEMRGVFKRHPISWELWGVIKQTVPNVIDYHSYIPINDYTVDIDTDEQARYIETLGV